MILYNQSFDFVLLSPYDVACPFGHITHLWRFGLFEIKWLTMLVDLVHQLDGMMDDFC
jgi:hypothetical protein